MANINIRFIFKALTVARKGVLMQCESLSEEEANPRIQRQARQEWRTDWQ